jgi:hypothetical protein
MFAGTIYTKDLMLSTGQERDIHSVGAKCLAPLDVNEAAATWFGWKVSVVDHDFLFNTSS